MNTGNKARLKGRKYIMIKDYFMKDKNLVFWLLLIFPPIHQIPIL